MDIKSEKALTVIAQSLHDSRRQWREIAESKESSKTEVADAEDYLIQLDQVFGAVRREYEKLRENNPSLMPFPELFND
jgi:hypothetical protein